MTKRYVWVVDSGEYEQNHIVGIWSTRKKAAAGIRAIYEDPYAVEWEYHLDEKWPWILGKFEAVSGYSIKHEAVFSFSKYEVN